jgi:aryl-alcohol dehydrogenase-like predicted oxidoreductase
MHTVTLGRDGPVVSTIGLGCMGMSGGYGSADDAEGIATIQAAIDSGVTLIDTGDFYGMGHNELLVREAIKGRRERVFVGVKFGALRSPDNQWNGYDLRPAAVKNFLAYSLRRLGTDYVDLYQPARIAGEVPVEEVVGAIADMVKAGYVRHVGLSEASAATVRRAAKVHPIAALQIEYSLFSRSVERDILPTLRELGIALVAYGVLSRGLITDATATARAPRGAIRERMPRFQGENFARNLALVEALRAISQEKGCSVAQFAIAWVRSRGDDIVPLLGSRTRVQLQDTLAAFAVTLTPGELQRIDAAVPAGAASGGRYGAAQMKDLDSER